MLTTAGVSLGFASLHHLPMLWPLLTELSLAVKVGGASAMQEKSIFLAIALRLDKFLTLDNENKLSLFSLNRNFALPLPGGEGRLRLNNAQINLALCSTCTTFVGKETINPALWPECRRDKPFRNLI